MEGYGEMGFAWLDYGPNQNRDGGSQEDSRVVFDLTRFVLEVEGEIPEAGLSFETEVEFEHGGTGAALELEYEEFGEFEQEVEKGGEVIVEEMYLRKTLGDRFAIKGGRFYVAMGLLSDEHRPTRFLSPTRPESETTVIPGVWDEMGLEGEYRHRWLRVRAQVVNGLDSTGFSSQYWVASGQQGRFEEIRATDLAVVGRVDVRPVSDVLIGVSGYRGGTSRNRPKPDLVRQCENESEDEVAPCGYVEAPVTIFDVHARVDLDPVLAQGVLLWGRLDNADDISERNARLSNLLGVLRTPVAEEAFAAWAEVGVNVLHWSRFGALNALSPFVRYEKYDTMYATRTDLFDNPRFEKQVISAGVSYRYEDAVVVKSDFRRRTFGSDDFRPETGVNLSAGFEF
ncbi:MAG: hypothetical protein IT350_15185 [Deltaproteobacteria bacterium]|nr:hypothetical protein [Deltaproteobacteria bacterium]